MSAVTSAAFAALPERVVLIVDEQSSTVKEVPVESLDMTVDLFVETVMYNDANAMKYQWSVSEGSKATLLDLHSGKPIDTTHTFQWHAAKDTTDRVRFILKPSPYTSVVKGKNAIQLWVDTCLSPFAGEDPKTWTVEKLLDIMKCPLSAKMAGNAAYDGFAYHSLFDYACLPANHTDLQYAVSCLAAVNEVKSKIKTAIVFAPLMDRFVEDYCNCVVDRGLKDDYDKQTRDYVIMDRDTRAVLMVGEDKAADGTLDDAVRELQNKYLGAHCALFGGLPYIIGSAIRYPTAQLFRISSNRVEPITKPLDMLQADGRESFALAFLNCIRWMKTVRIGMTCLPFFPFRCVDMLSRNAFGFPSPTSVTIHRNNFQKCSAVPPDRVAALRAAYQLKCKHLVSLMHEDSCSSMLPAFYDGGLIEGGAYVQVRMVPLGWKRTPSSTSEAATLLRDVLSALSALHSSNLCHCDVRLPNIMETGVWDGDAFTRYWVLVDLDLVCNAGSAWPECLREHTLIPPGIVPGAAWKPCHDLWQLCASVRRGLRLLVDSALDNVLTRLQDCDDATQALKLYSSELENLAGATACTGVGTVRPRDAADSSCAASKRAKREFERGDDAKDLYISIPL